MPAALGSPLFWRKIKRFVKNRTLLLVLRPGIITFGEENNPFYPWLVDQLVVRQQIDMVPEQLYQRVCTHRRNHRQLEEIFVEVDELLENPSPPSRLLRELAPLSQYQAFFNFSCTPLAVEPEAVNPPITTPEPKTLNS